MTEEPDYSLPFPDDSGFVCPICGEVVEDENEICAECKSAMVDYTEER